MPFLYPDHSISHVPDIDINFGLGDRVQLTYESAWLRVKPSDFSAKYGPNQSNFGVKWRFYDAGPSGWSISTFPQGFVNNPGDAVRRGITPPNNSFLVPVEVSKNFGPVSLDAEVGYQFVFQGGADAWLTGLVLGHDFTKRLELDFETYSQGTFQPSDSATTFGFGGRYRLHRPVILLFMAGRSFSPASPTQPYFVGYFGLQLLLPSRAYDKTD